MTDRAMQRCVAIRLREGTLHFQASRATGVKKEDRCREVARGTDLFDS
jgi:hypothetical protein